MFILTLRIVHLHRKSLNGKVDTVAKPAKHPENKNNPQRHALSEPVNNSRAATSLHKRNRPNLIWKEWSKR